MASLSPVGFGSYISNSGTVIGAASGITSGFMYQINAPVANFTLQTNAASAFSGVISVQLIGSLDGVSYFPLASGLVSGAVNTLTFTAINGPVQYFGTQITNFSGAGTGAAITTYVWAK